MSLMFGSRRDFSLIDGTSVPAPSRWGRGFVSRRAALAHSAAWACLRLRGDLISTLPVDVFRLIGANQVEVPKPRVLRNPGGETIDVTEWLYSSQVDLDSCGNTFGIITERDGNNLPARIDLVPREEVTVRVRDGIVSYLINGESHSEDQVWHERQFTSSGLVVGLSPIAHAAHTFNQFISAQEFAMNWFAGGAIPTGMLKNENAVLDPAQTDAVKARFRLAVENGDLFVTGKDWDYKVIEAQASQASFLETMRATDIDVCRFFGVPGDLIDAQVPGGSITYANITQRNLQLLITNLGPAIVRREKALSRLVIAQRFVKLNSGALLRMDPETVAKMLGQRVRDRILAPSEARALENLPPFTPEQLEEFQQLWPNIYNNKPGADARAAVADASDFPNPYTMTGA